MRLLHRNILHRGYHTIMRYENFMGITVFPHFMFATKLSIGNGNTHHYLDNLYFSIETELAFIQTNEEKKIKLQIQ